MDVDESIVAGAKTKTTTNRTKTTANDFDGSGRYLRKVLVW